MLDRLIKHSGLKLSLNDPRWGRGGSSKDDDHPEGDRQDPARPERGFEERPGKPERPERKPESKPDIEQMWDDFNKKIARLVKKRPSGGGGNGGRGFRSPIKLSRLVILAALVLGISVWVSNGVFIVQDGQTAVVSTFGKFSYLARPGTNWIMPEPIQTYHLVDTGRLHTVEVGYRSNVSSRVQKEALMPTSDGSYADVQISVEYRIHSAADYYFNGTDVDGTIRAMAESVLRQRVAQLTFDQVMYGDHTTLTNGVAEMLQASLDQYKSGVKVENVLLQTVREPLEVRPAWDDLVKAQDDSGNLKAQAQAYAQMVTNRAGEQAAVQLADAQAYRNRVVTIAQGDTARFRQVLEEYRKAPGVTRDRMYLDTMQDIYTHSSKILVDAKNITSITIPPIAPSATGTAPAAGTAETNDAIRKPDTSAAGVPAANNSAATPAPSGKSDAQTANNADDSVDATKESDEADKAAKSDKTDADAAAKPATPAAALAADKAHPDSPAAMRSRDPSLLRSREGR